MAKNPADAAPNAGKPDPATAKTRAARALEQAEAADPTGADRLEEVKSADAPSVDAAEQEASEAPGGLGLSR